MKKAILQISILLTLIIAANLPAFSQTQSSQTVSKDQTVTFLIRQNENARELITKQEARINDLETELSAEKENSASIQKSYESAKSEISSLQKSNESLSKAIQINESTITLLQKDNIEQREKVKRANKAKYKAYLIAAGAIALKLLLP